MTNQAGLSEKHLGWLKADAVVIDSTGDSWIKGTDEEWYSKIALNNTLGVWAKNLVRLFGPLELKED